MTLLKDIESASSLQTKLFTCQAVLSDFIAFSYRSYVPTLLSNAFRVGTVCICATRKLHMLRTTYDTEKIHFCATYVPYNFTRLLESSWLAQHPPTYDARVHCMLNCLVYRSRSCAKTFTPFARRAYSTNSRSLTFRFVFILFNTCLSNYRVYKLCQIFIGFVAAMETICGFNRVATLQRCKKCWKFLEFIVSI